MAYQYIRFGSPHISSGLKRVSRWRVGANDKITSDTYESAQSPLGHISDLSHLLGLSVRSDKAIEILS